MSVQVVRALACVDVCVVSFFIFLATNLAFGRSFDVASYGALYGASGMGLGIWLGCAAAQSREQGGGEG